MAEYGMSTVSGTTEYYKNGRLVASCDPKTKQCKGTTPAPKKRMVVGVAAPKAAKPEKQSWASKLLFGESTGTGLTGCGTEPGIVETNLEDGVILNPEGAWVTFEDLEPSTEDTRRATIVIDDLPEIYLAGKNLEDLDLEIEIGTNSTAISVAGEASPCIEGMFDPYSPDAETALPVTITNMEISNNRSDQSEANEEAQALGSLCEDKDIDQPAPVLVPSGYYFDGLLDFSLKLEVEVDMSNWTGSENVQALLYVRLKKKAN